MITDEPSKEIKVALEQASDNDLLNEVFRRGLIVGVRERPALNERDKAAADREIRFREMLRRRKLQERRQETRRRIKEAGRKPGDMDEAVESLRASTAKHYEYVGQLFDLLRRKRLDKMRERCVRRANNVLEFASFGSFVTETVFDHLVIAWRDALDAGACNIESLWEYLMSDGGYQFASGLVKADIDMPPDLWASFIYQTIQGAAGYFLDIVEEDAEEPANEDHENGDKNPDFIN